MAVANSALVLCFFSSFGYLYGDQGADINYRLLVQRHAGAENSIQEAQDVFDTNLFSNKIEIISETEYFAGFLGVYYSIPRSIIDSLRPGPLPYGKIVANLIMSSDINYHI